MLFWIDATKVNDEIDIFGLSLVERHLHVVREISELHVTFESMINKISALTPGIDANALLAQIPARTATVRIDIPNGAEIPELPKKLRRKLSLRWVHTEAPFDERLSDALKESDGKPLLALSGDTVIDARVAASLSGETESTAFVTGEGDERCAAILFCPGKADLANLAEAVTSSETLCDVGEKSIANGSAVAFDTEKFDGYIPTLRRTQEPYLFSIRDAQNQATVERYLFWSNYKGATDFMTKHVYPPLVWRMVKPLAQRRIHPNLVTLIAMVATFLAIPFFAAAAWVPGMILAFGMSVLDSVDGKLARLTFTSSAQGNLLDHGTDLIHPPFWYFGWAWGLSGGDPFSDVFQAAVWLMAIYTVDRVLETLFKACTDKSVQDFRPLDIRLRTFSSRRNVNLDIFVIALPFGLGEEAFYFIVGWAALTTIYHLVRVIQFWDGDPEQEDGVEELGEVVQG